MTKRFLLFASFFAMAAIFLALMTNGCSESDRNKNNNEPSVPNALTAIVGWDAANGCPETKYLVIGLADADNQYVAMQAFAAEKDEYISAEWSEIEPDVVSMTMPLSDEVLAAKPVHEFVIATNGNGDVKGFFHANQVLVEGENIVDFRDYEFIKADDVEGFLTIDQVSESSGTISIYKDKKTPITVTHTVTWTENGKEVTIAYDATPVASLVTDKPSVLTVNQEDHSITGTEVATEEETCPTLTATLPFGMAKAETKVFISQFGVDVFCIMSELPSFINPVTIVPNINGTDGKSIEWTSAMGAYFVILTNGEVKENDVVKLTITENDPAGVKTAIINPESTTMSSTPGTNNFTVTGWKK